MLCLLSYGHHAPTATRTRRVHPRGRRAVYPTDRGGVATIGRPPLDARYRSDSGRYERSGDPT